MTPLGDVAEFEMGQAPPGSECNTDGLGMVFVKAGEFAAVYPLEREWTTKPLKFGRKGDVFICVVGATAGKLNLGIDCAIGRSVAAIRPAPTLDTKFLYYQLQPWVLRLRGASAGSAQGVISKRLLAQIPVHVISLQEQRSVVAEIEKQFSRLDEAVANLHRVKVSLRNYERSVLQETVGAQGMQPEGTLPMGWQWSELASLGELARGKSKHRPRDDTRLYGGPHPFIQTGDVSRSDGVIRAYSQTYSDFGLAQSRLWPAGTLCITIAANIAKTGILAMPACFPDSVVGFLSEDLTLTRYVELFMRTAREGLERFAPATAQKNINLAILERVLVPLPDAEQREQIVAEVDHRLSIVRGVEAQVDANLKRAQALRQAVLAKAFGGAGADR